MRACIFTFLLGVLLTGCSGGGAEESQATTTDSADVTEVVIEGVCPMSGEAVDDEISLAFNGQTVKFCCTDCRDSWEKLSDEEKETKLASAKDAAAAK